MAGPAAPPKTQQRKPPGGSTAAAATSFPSRIAIRHLQIDHPVDARRAACQPRTDPTDVATGRPPAFPERAAGSTRDACPPHEGGGGRDSRARPLAFGDGRAKAAIAGRPGPPRHRTRAFSDRTRKVPPGSTLAMGSTAGRGLAGECQGCVTRDAPCPASIPSAESDRRRAPPQISRDVGAGAAHVPNGNQIGDTEQIGTHRPGPFPKRPPGRSR